jgi:DNA mismatch endonuclease (patch repair protein)
MPDIFTKEKRSDVMSKIRRVSMLEKEFAKVLSKEVYPLGYRYRRNYRKVPGSPDFAFTKQKIAVFIDGDFWHGYQYSKKKGKLPKFWQEKIERNIKRDRRNRALLKKMGWTYIRLWEHEIKKNPLTCLEKLSSSLAGSSL